MKNKVGFATGQPRASGNPNQDTRHFEFVDALRGLAFLGVVIVHAVVFSKNPPWIVAHIGGFGQYGVQLFYVASAFTLMLSFDQRASVDQRPVLAFFLRRIFRVLPMYWVAIGAYFLGHALFTDKITGSTALTHLLANITFVHGWHPQWINSTVPGGWSVGVETSFYLILPLLFLCIRSLRGALVFFAATLCIHLVTATAINELVIDVFGTATRGSVPRFSYYWFPAQLPVFALGVVLFFLLKDRLLSPGTSHRSPAKAAMAMTLAIAIPIGMMLVNGIPKPLVVNWSQIAAGIAALCFSYALASCPYRLLVNRFTRYLGTISYSGYLCHYGIVQGWVAVLNKIDAWGVPLSPWIFVATVFALSLTTTLLVSTYTYRLIEKPGMALGKRLIAALHAGAHRSTGERKIRHPWPRINPAQTLPATP